MHKGKYNGLGGKFLPGETPEECAIREVQEESGLTMIEPRFKGIITFPLFDGTNDWYVFLFNSSRYTGEIIESNEGNLEWIDNDKLLDLPLWEGDKIFLKWLDYDRLFSAKFVYENGKLISHTVNFY